MFKISKLVRNLSSYKSVLAEYFLVYNKVISKRKTIFFIVYSFFYALMEIATLGVTALFIRIVSDNNSIDFVLNNPTINRSFPFLISYITTANFFIFFLIIICIRYFFSLLYFRNVYSVIFNVSTDLNDIISDAIFKQKYITLKNEEYQSTKNVFYKEIDYYITYFVQPLLLLVPDVFQLFFMLVFLVLLLPKFSIVIIVILAFVVFNINKVIKSKVSSISGKLTIHQRRRTLILGNFYSNILFWRVKNLQGKLNEYFVSENKVISKSNADLNFYQQIPRVSFEFLIYFIFCLLALLNMSAGKQIFSSYVIMGLAAIRLLPSAVKFSSFVQSALSAKMIIETLNAILRKGVREDNDKAVIMLTGFSDKIVLKDAVFSYQKHKILNNCNFVFEKGDIISISGNSGAGKSTAIEVLLRQLDLTAGQLIFDGIDITHEQVDYSHIVGIVPQSIQFNNDTLRENLLFGTHHTISDDQIYEVLEKCNMLSFVKKLPQGLDTLIDNNSNSFSGGERQRIAIARCLLDKDVRILIFDEITSALDEQNSIGLLDSIMNFKQAYSIIFITHNVLIRKYCTKNYEFKDGQLKMV